MVGPWLELVRVPPSGTWAQRRAHLFQTAERWVGPEERVALDDALDQLVRSYLAAFGPAPRGDIALWAGVKARDLAPALERLTLRRFRDEQGKELLDVHRAPLPDPETPAPVRFLPTWDATLLVHARRTGILPEHFRSAHLLDEDAALVRDVPRGRPGRGHVALRGRPRARGAVRAARPQRRTRGRRGGEPARGLPRVAHNARAMSEDDHVHVVDPEESEAWRRVLNGDLGQLKYFRAVLGKIPAGPRCKLCAAPLKAPGSLAPEAARLRPVAS